MTYERAILHSDLNSFYASVEIMLNPNLKGKPVAVCGSTESRHGIVLAKSDPAKKCGIRTGMVNMEARQRCKDLIIVPPQYDEYIKYSRLTKSIYERFTDRIEPFGMDECWMDVTGSSIFGSPTDIAEQIRKSVREELGLTVSIGVSFNKIFAKLGSDMKKPDAITEITPGDVYEKIWPLHCSEMIYCGPATTRKLAMYGITTIGDIAKTDPLFLKKILGLNGLALWNYASGNDQSRVMHKDFTSPIKSIGHGITCTADLLNEEEVFHVMLELSQDIGHRLRIHGLSAQGVQVYIRCNDLSGYQYQCMLPVKTQLPGELASAGFHIFKEHFQWKHHVRSVCIRAIKLKPKDTPEQISMFDDTVYRIRHEHLEDAVENIRSRFGKKSITYASLLNGLKIPEDGRDKVRMPGLMYR